MGNNIDSIGNILDWLNIDTRNIGCLVINLKETKEKKKYPILQIFPFTTKHTHNTIIYFQLDIKRKKICPKIDFEYFYLYDYDEDDYDNDDDKRIREFELYVVVQKDVKITIQK